MPRALERALTEVSPVLPGSTADQAWSYIGGTVASPASDEFEWRDIYIKAGCVPITELKPFVDSVKEGSAGGAGLGAALQGSIPSSYTELSRGFSVAMKLAPNWEEPPPYGWTGRGALNMVR